LHLVTVNSSVTGWGGLVVAIGIKYSIHLTTNENLQIAWYFYKNPFPKMPLEGTRNVGLNLKKKNVRSNFKENKEKFDRII
jgi:hypothetical protein